MKKLIALLLTVIVIFCLVACSAISAPSSTTKSQPTETVSSNSPTETAETKTVTAGGKNWDVTGYPKAPTNVGQAISDIKIAAVVYREDTTQSLILQGAKDAAQKYGVQIVTQMTGGDVAKDLQYISTYSVQDIDGIIWAPYDISLITPLKGFVDSGKPVVLINGLTVGPADYFHGVFANKNNLMSAQLGEIAAPIVSELYKDKKINIGIVEYKGLNAESSGIRVNSFLEALVKLGLSYTVVADQDATAQDIAIQVAGDMITAHPEMNLIFCANEGALIGATNAVKTAGKEGDIYVFGIDVSVQICKLMRDNSILQCAVGQNAYMGGYKAAEQLIKILMGGNENEVSQYYGTWYPLENLVINKKDPQTLTDYQKQMTDLGIWN